MGSHMALFNGRATQDGPDSAKMSTRAWEISDISSIWIPKFWARFFLVALGEPIVILSSAQWRYLLLPHQEKRRKMLGLVQGPVMSFSTQGVPWSQVLKFGARVSTVPRLPY